MTWCCIAFLVKCKTHGAKPLHAKMNKNGCQHLGLGSVGSSAKVKVATQDTHSHTNPHKTGLTVPLMHDCVPQLHLGVHRGTPPGLQTHSKSQQSLCNLFLTSAILLAGLLSFCPAVSYFFQHITDQHKIWQTPAYVQHHKRPSELAWFRSTFTALLRLDVYSVSQYVQRWLRGAVMPNLFVSPSRQAETASLTGS